MLNTDYRLPTSSYSLLVTRYSLRLPSRNVQPAGRALAGEVVARMGALLRARGGSGGVEQDAVAGLARALPCARDGVVVGRGWVIERHLIEHSQVVDGGGDGVLGLGLELHLVLLHHDEHLVEVRLEVLGGQSALYRLGCHLSLVEREKR